MRRPTSRPLHRALCARIRASCGSADAGTRPPTPHALGPARGSTATPSIPDSRRPANHLSSGRPTRSRCSRGMPRTSVARPRSGPFPGQSPTEGCANYHLAWSAWVHLLYHQQTKNLLVAYSTQKLGFTLTALPQAATAPAADTMPSHPSAMWAPSPKIRALDTTAVAFLPRGPVMKRPKTAPPPASSNCQLADAATTATM